MTTDQQALGRDARALRSELVDLPARLSIAARAVMAFDPAVDPELAGTDRADKLLNLRRGGAGALLAASRNVELAIALLGDFIEAGQLVD